MLNSSFCFFLCCSIIFLYGVIISNTPHNRNVFAPSVQKRANMKKWHVKPFPTAVEEKKQHLEEQCEEVKEMCRSLELYCNILRACGVGKAFFPLKA
jgi:hypothetical protein